LLPQNRGKFARAEIEQGITLEIKNSSQVFLALTENGQRSRSHRPFRFAEPEAVRCATLRKENETEENQCILQSPNVHKMQPKTEAEVTNAFPMQSQQNRI